MIELDDLILGDNQFFGINHMSQQKAQELAERFNDISQIVRAYHTAYDLGIHAFMLNSNDRAEEICDYLRMNADRFPELGMYASVPYPHKYANLVAEKGIIGTLQEVLSGRSAMSLLGLAGSGLSMLTGDMTKIMTTLVDVEMSMFRDLNVKVVFLQNIVTDLILGLALKDFFVAYARHIRNKYNAAPGFLTMNVPRLAAFLESSGVEESVICGSVNKLGYLMSPDKAAYEEYFTRPQKYAVTAISIYASGAIPAAEAIAYVRQLGIQSIVFGASSRDHMKQTIELARSLDVEQAMEPSAGRRA
jgi:hypothetical protein